MTRVKRSDWEEACSAPWYETSLLNWRKWSIPTLHPPPPRDPGTGAISRLAVICSAHDCYLALLQSTRDRCGERGLGSYSLVLIREGCSSIKNASEGKLMKIGNFTYEHNRSEGFSNKLFATRPEHFIWTNVASRKGSWLVIATSHIGLGQELL